jgi:predicted nucleic acid-binding protein
MTTCLLDTGPLVAALDSSDPAHGRVRKTLTSFHGRLFTTGAVVTEAFYLLRYARFGPERLVDFVEQTGLTLIDVFTVENLRQISELMSKYADQPMDFADASLVLIAEQRGYDEILTLDQRGFSAYRFQRNRRFKLLLDKG